MTGEDLDFLIHIPVGVTNSYALDSGEGLILIDTGVPSEQNWGALTRGLRDAGHDVRDVRLMLLTHSHFDHSGLAGRVREESGAPVLIHRADAPFLSQGGGNMAAQSANYRRMLEEHGVPARLLDLYGRVRRRRGGGWFQDWRRQEQLFDEHLQVRWDILEREETPATAVDRPQQPAAASRPLPPPTADRLLEDGEIITLGRLSLRAVHTPGHTPGHLCYTMDEPRLIFTGDHVLKRTTPNPTISFIDGRYDQRTRSLPWYVESLQRVRSLVVDRVLPAHEEEIAELEPAVDRILRHHERRASQARSALEAGPLTGFDLMPHLFPKLRFLALWLGMVEVIGHLDLLEDRGEVEAFTRGGGVAYRLTGKAQDTMRTKGFLLGA